MLIPIHHHIQDQLFRKVLEATNKHHNNMGLGEVVRSIIQDYKDKYIPPSDIELDKDNG